MSRYARAFVILNEVKDLAMQTLRKYFTREFSLITLTCWDQANRIGIGDWVEWVDKDTVNLLFFRPQDSPKASVWYEPAVFDRFVGDVRSRVSTDPAYFRRVADAYRERFAPVLDIADGRKPLRTVADFRAAVVAYAHWWDASSVIYVAAGMNGLPEAVEKESRELRFVEEKYGDVIDQTLTAFCRQYGKRLTGLADCVTPDEVVKEITTGLTTGDVEEIRARRSGWGMLNGAVFRVADLQENLARAGLSLEEERVNGHVNEVRGQGVSAGHARGPVRRIRGRADLPFFRDGEILVTEMTHPDYVPAMRKAAAFVTDEGGMTSHAAIVSRELGKPCVVGTKIATKVLHDGDLVEVDAEKGVVRIIRKT